MLSSRSTGVLVLLAGLALAASAPAQQAPAAPAPAPPAADTQVVKLEAVHVVVLPMKGSYMQHPDAFARLGGYLAGRGVTPSGSPIGCYYSDPSVGEANLVWEIGFPVPAGTAAEAPFEIRDLPAASYAVHVHKGPMEEIGPAWGSLIGWVMSNGYQPILPAMQVFRGDMIAGGEVELRIAVQK
jgi:effector-binding domain-containing protein